MLIKKNIENKLNMNQINFIFIFFKKKQIIFEYFEVF